jgi:hypothetical protein
VALMVTSAKISAPPPPFYGVMGLSRNCVDESTREQQYSELPIPHNVPPLNASERFLLLEPDFADNRGGLTYALTILMDQMGDF